MAQSAFAHGVGRITKYKHKPKIPSLSQLKKGKDTTEDVLMSPGMIFTASMAETENGYRYDLSPDDSSTSSVSIDERPTWDNPFEFRMACISMVVGMSNVYRFPQLTYSFGGGTYIIAYVVLLFAVGIPLFYLELLIGQFSSTGPLTLWEINPLFKGLGYSMLALQATVAIYYSIWLAWGIFYMFASLETILPWATCENSWNTCYCRTTGTGVDLPDEVLMEIYETTGRNCSGINFTAVNVVLSSEEYYNYRVLKKSTSIFEFQGLQTELTACSLLGWIVIMICLVEGIRTMGKVAVVPAVIPLIQMFAMVARELSLQGAERGVQLYLQADLEKLMDPHLWLGAAGMLIFSLGASGGSLLTLASYNRFHANIMWDSLLIPILDFLMSFLSGFALFSILGVAAESAGVPVHTVASTGPDLMFVAYPAALATMPLCHFWSVMFFVMSNLIGLGSQLCIVETILTGMTDEIETLRSRYVADIFRPAACFVLFLGGLPLTTHSGFFLVEMCHRYAVLPFLFLGFFEVVAIVWIYGHDRLAEDIQMMLGWSKWTRLIHEHYYFYSWKYLSPTIMLTLMVLKAFTYKPLITKQNPVGAEFLGWLLVIGIIGWTPYKYVVELHRRWNMDKSGTHDSILKKFHRANQPTRKWGPKLTDDRRSPRYRTPRQAPILPIKSIPELEESDLSIQITPNSSIN